MDTHTVENLVPVFQPPQDRHSVLHRRLFHQNRLEAALQSGVLFDRLPVLVQGGGADDADLPPAQGGLDDVSGVYGALGAARAHDGVQFVDEQQNSSLRLANFLQHCLESFLELPPVLCARDERAHIQRENGLILQPVRHVAPDNALGKPLRDSGLPHARFPDEHGVILSLPGQNTDHTANFPIPPDDRVKLVVPGPLHQVGAVFRQRVVGILRVVVGHRPGLDLGQFLGKPVFCDIVVLKQPAQFRCRLRQQRQHQMLHRNVAVFQVRRGFFRQSQHFRGLPGRVNIPAAGDLRQLFNDAVQFRQHPVAVHAHTSQ